MERVRTVIVIRQISSAQSELCDGSWRNTGTGRCIANETTIAATGSTGGRTRVGREVAIGTSLFAHHSKQHRHRSHLRRILGRDAHPDTTCGPVVWNGEGDGGSSCLLPSRCLRGYGGSCVQVGEHARPAISTIRKMALNT